jgi:ferrous iron transport protein B
LTFLKRFSQTKMIKMSDTMIKVALAGNPNAGKTTLFNALTGSRQHVGNYPGVTVERKQGFCNLNGFKLVVTDLPGTYSLTAVSEEEIVSRNFLIEGDPQVVVGIVDSSNLERNLYLMVQLLELNAPLLMVLNMVDVAARNGLAIDTEKLSELLRVPVLSTVGHKKQGLDDLRTAMQRYLDSPPDRQALRINYGPDIEQAIILLTDFLDIPGPLGEHNRWLAIKMLENDSIILEKIRRHMPENHPIWETLRYARQRILKIYGDTPEIIIADRRYGFISGIWQEVAKTGVEFRHNFSDNIDSVLTHPALGLPIFLGLMYAVFYFTFTLADPPMRLIEHGVEWLGGFIGGFWPAGSESDLKSLLVDGVIGGVGSVIVFLPNILLLFFGIALLEDTGYMARAAFIMDRFMHKIGLHGKSFIPMLIGFGCSVPAIMSARILDNKRDRMTTIMIIPLMSCGARIAIYSLFIPAFFLPKWQAPVLWIIYVTGIVVAGLLAKFLRFSVFKGESAGLVMELPPYRMPTFKGLLLHMWHNGWQYLKKAGTVILAMSIVLWAMTTYPKLPEEKLAQYDTPAQKQSASLQHSLIGRIGHAMEPAIRPLGFDWRIGTALVSAVPAKEMFVAQMGILFAVDEETSADAPAHENQALREKLRKAYSPLTAFCVMIFCLLATPCFATVAVTLKETNSWLWAAVQFFGLTAVGYVITLIIFQIGSLIM